MEPRVFGVVYRQAAVIVNRTVIRMASSKLRRRANFIFRSGDNAGEFHRAQNFHAVLRSAAEIRADFIEAFLKFRKVRS